LHKISHMPVKYLDPKNDLTFRRIFGEHPKLLISFLNAMLPLDENRHIESIEYLDSEIIPELPGLKRSIVDVRCTDNFKRQFIVEMQMYWTSSFRSRMLFNASKAYVKQLHKKGKFSELNPAYGLSLVNEDFQTSKEFEQIYYHHYRMVHNIDSKDYIPGIELVFVELQKFKSLNFTGKKLQVLWLKFLTEIDENTVVVPKELQNEENIKQALDCLQESAFSTEELEYYEKYWDTVRVEKTAISEAIEKEQKKQALLELQIEEERHQKEAALAKEKEAREKEKEAMFKLAKKMKKYSEPLEEIVKETGLSKDEIEKL
jgi:predicted transposase/invertase (TIGR01784 family)